MNPLIPMILEEFSLDDYRPIHPRDLDLGEPLVPRAGNLVKVVTGMRRTGKSYRLFQEMDRLLARGVDPSRICYFNFEDDRLAPLTPRTGDEVLEAFFARGAARGIRPGDGVYLFFDELQEMEGWDRWARRIVDTTRATIYATGSSSRLLAEEVATGFRGRAIDFELHPYSFSEYERVLAAGEGGQGAAGGGSRDERILGQHHLDRYLEEGGFPATVGLPRSQAVALLQSYAERVTARDVVERYDLPRPRVASLFAQRLLGSNGRQLSIRAIENDFRSVGVIANRTQLGDLLDHYDRAYLVSVVREFGRALVQGGNTRPKIYAADPGLALATARAGTNDLGQRLENVVYLELLRRTPGLRRDRVTFFRTRAHGLEVDFAAGDPSFGYVTHLYQVCADLGDPRTLKREVRALDEALGELAGHGADEAGGAAPADGTAPAGTIILGTSEPAAVADARSLVAERAEHPIEVVPALTWLRGR